MTSARLGISLSELDPPLAMIRSRHEHGTVSLHRAYQVE